MYKIMQDRMKYPQHILKKVIKPIRYVGLEYNAIVKDLSSVKSLVALVFPEVYEIGMSHLGLRILYHHLNKNPIVAAERVYCPWPDMEAELRKKQIPLLSIESGIPLADFNIVGISLLYEMTFTNILTVLDLGGIPIYSKDRTFSHPLVVGGGPATSNPEPVADFFDLFLIGDGEENFDRIVEMELATRGDAYKNRIEYLEQFSRIKGVYVPVLYSLRKDGTFFVIDQDQPGFKQVEKSCLLDLDSYPLPDKTLVPSTEIVHDRITAEISRGCMQGCRFCHASVFYRPQRERGAKELIEWILKTVKETGYEDVSLASLSALDYGGIEELAYTLTQSLKPMEVGLSFPSIRISELSSTLAESIATIRKTGFTLAPEAGSQRMRDIINKRLTEKDILEGVMAAYSNGWDLVKLYFMIGLPHEEESDVRAIADLIHKIWRHVGLNKTKGRKRAFRLNVTISPFVPKPHTPFQWERMNTLDELMQKKEILFSLIKNGQIRLKWHDARVSRLEGVFSRGDRMLSNVILRAWLKGARFDGWSEYFNESFWIEAFEECGINPDTYLGELSSSHLLPWSHITMGVDYKFLLSERLRASKGEVTTVCGVIGCNQDATIRKRCWNCGVDCNLREMSKKREQNLKFLSQSTVGGDRNKNEKHSRVKYRIKFTKLGDAIWLSHLDLVRTIQRILRRASIPIRYTKGFHPHPVIGFSPALGVGFGSRGEYIDVESEGLGENPSLWLSRLNDVSLEGISFLEISPLSQEMPSIEKWAKRALWSILLTSKDLENYLSQSVSSKENNIVWLKGKIESLLKKQKLVILRQRKGKASKNKDLRPFIETACCYERDSLVTIELKAVLSPQGSINPREWLEFCLPGYGEDYYIERICLEG